MASFDLAGHTFSFSGHETFVFRYFWLKKAVDAVRLDPRVFAQEDAIVTLGVGKNMVRSIRHWGLATGVLEEEPKSRGAMMKVSSFGEFLFGGERAGVDPYLEDPNSLWLLHWHLIANSERSTTWQWAFNRFPSNEFTREGLLQSVEDESRRLNLIPPSESTLKRDIEVFVRTYLSGRGSRSSMAVEDSLDCPLTELGLLEELSGASLLKIKRGPKSTLSNPVFAYCLLQFWNRVASAGKSLAFSEIAYAQNGPGTIFKLDENSLIERLEKLQITTSGCLGYTESAGLKQVYRQGNCDGLSWLRAHYEESNPVLVGV